METTAARYPYNVWQQIYCLSAASNSVAAKVATEADLQAAMERALEEKLPRIGGDWRVSWGPRVYKPRPEKKGAVENAWFAAASEARKLVVVAVAGTAPVSLRDWLDDVDVARVVDFDGWVGRWGGGRRARARRRREARRSRPRVLRQRHGQGVYNILGNKAPASHTYLWQYLRTVTPD
ncbi:hypothetical protein LX36DRAFT_714581 [Colletotrichum falcatum]|nr:hypothetical protein LX36DRAFT_714581 [Colletotrichum falcatum]